MYIKYIDHICPPSLPLVPTPEQNLFYILILHFLSVYSVDFLFLKIKFIFKKKRHVLSLTVFVGQESSMVYLGSSFQNMHFWCQWGLHCLQIGLRLADVSMLAHPCNWWVGAACLPEASAFPQVGFCTGCLSILKHAVLPSQNELPRRPAWRP
jgi:hypothetical protein